MIDAGLIPHTTANDSTSACILTKGDEYGPLYPGGDSTTS